MRKNSAFNPPVSTVFSVLFELFKTISKISGLSYKHLCTRQSTCFSRCFGMDRKIKTLIRAGYYSSEFEVIKDAMISLFRENTELKINAAIELYKGGEVSLGKAVEIAGVTTIEFKEILGKRGIIREIEARPAEKMDRKLKKYLQT